MKPIPRFLLFFLLIWSWAGSAGLFAQMSPEVQINQIGEWLEEGELELAYDLCRSLEKEVDMGDSLSVEILWFRVATTTMMERQARIQEDWKQAVEYGEEALELIIEGKEHFEGEFPQREYWMRKNLIVNYFGQKKYKSAMEMRDFFYEAYEKEEMPEGLKEYYNFEYFTLDGLNVYGYEWFAPLPKNRHSSSFAKIVYYVYDTDGEGADRNQLFRLHVQMFHHLGDEGPFDYVLTFRASTENGEHSRTLYRYTYQDPVDFKQLQKDVRKVIPMVTGK